jgi:hypothetical protein
MIAHFSTLALLLDAAPDTKNVQFFTLDTLFTAAGATTAIFTITSVMHGIFPKISPKYLALTLSWFFTFVGIGVHGSPYSLANCFLAFINGFVIYVAAVGINNVSTAPNAGGGGGVGAPAAPAPTRSYRWWA